MESDSSRLGLTLLFLVLLALSSFFSGSETAFFSLSKASLRSLRQRTDSGARRVLRMLDKPRELLIALLIGNTLVNVAIASVAAITVEAAFNATGLHPALILALNVLVVTFVLIIVAEISPKVFALKNNESWALAVSGPVMLVSWLFYPITRILVAFVEGVARVVGVESQRVLFSEEELRTLAEVGEEHGVLEEDEREMIHSIFEFSETEVQEVMVPRIDVAALPKEASRREAVELVREKGHSRIPIFEGDLDHVVGLLYAKDLIGVENGHDEPVEPLIREAYFVPKGKMIADLLREFQTHRLHLAIVVDEYGGTEGLITMEDIIEEIVGEIQDEYDADEILYKPTGGGEAIVLAKLEVEDFNQLVEEDLVPTDEDYETLGGFIFSLAGEVPDPGQSYEFEGWTFTVDAVEGNRIVSIRVGAPELEEEPSKQAK